MTTTTVKTPTYTPTRHRFTVAEYHAMADAGIFSENERVELLDGDIINMPPIGDWHQASIDFYTNILPQLLQGRAIVRIQGPTRLCDESEPQPDVMLLKWRDDFYRDGHPEPSDVLLLIEVSDTSIEYDRSTKLSAYARTGIPEVWILSRDDRRIESYTEPSEGTYSSVRHVRPTDTIAPQAFPDVTIEVGQFFPKPKPKPKKSANP